MEELGADVSARDQQRLHLGASCRRPRRQRDDPLSGGQGTDVTAVARSGQNTVELANGPAQRIQPFVETHRAAGAAGGEKQSPLRELLRGAGERFRGQIARFRAEKCLLFCMSMEIFSAPTASTAIWCQLPPH